MFFPVNGVATSRMYPCYIRDVTAREVRERSARSCQTCFLSIERGDGMACAWPKKNMIRCCRTMMFRSQNLHDEYAPTVLRDRLKWLLFAFVARHRFQLAFTLQ